MNRAATETSNICMRTHHAVAALLLAALIVVLLAWTRGGEVPSLEPEVATGDAGDGTSLQAARARTEAPKLATPPRLEPPVVRGPVRARVIGVASTPLPGVYVAVRKTQHGARRQAPAHERAR